MARGSRRRGRARVLGAALLALMTAGSGGGCRAPVRSDRGAPPAPTTGGSSPAPPPAEAGSVAAQPAGQPPGRGAGPLSLRLSLAEERTGGEFRLVVPMLRLEVRNEGAVEVPVPRPGVDLLLSLRLHLLRGSKAEPGEKEEVRHVRSFLSWPVTTEALSPGGDRVQLLSPLSREQKDVPLAPGLYRTRVCVIPHAEALYPSSFTQGFGGSCSNTVELSVKRR